MKRKVCLLFTFAVMMCLIFCFGISASAAEIVETGKVGDDVTWALYDDGELIISGTGEMYDYDNLENFTPFYVGNFSKVVIEDGVTSIGDGVFTFAHLFTEITIADSVTSIGDRAFENAFSLKYISIPDSVISIGDDVFVGCSYLEKITVDPDNKYYSNDSYGVLFDKDKSHLIACPANKILEEYAIPDSVTKLSTYAFYGCWNIKSVIIPEDVTEIPDYAFQACTKLISVTIPDGVTSIGEYAFANCYALKNITLPEALTSIGERALWACSSIISLTIPEGITEIPSYAFSCSSLTSITIPDSVVKIGPEAFYYCESATSITIGKNVQEIGFGAFWGCKIIESIYIPASVTFIDKAVFTDCFNLKKIEVDENNENYISVDGVLFNKNKTELLRYPMFKEGAVYTVPESVETFDYYAFEDCENIEYIIIGSKINTLSSCLFQDCINLKKVEFLGELTRINNSSFENCVNLSEIIIHDTVTNIDLWAFRNCPSLKSINIPKNVSYIGQAAFDKCNALEDVYYAGSEEDWKNISIIEDNNPLHESNIHFNFAKENLEDKIEVELIDNILVISGSDGMLSIGNVAEYTLSEYSDTTTQIILDGIDAVGTNVFENFSKVNCVIINGNSIAIENGAFSGCTDLSVVVSYTEFNCAETAFTGNTRSIKYFVEASAGSNVSSIPFSFAEDFVVIDGENIPTHKTVIDGDVSLTETEFKNLVSALYYGSDNNFVNMIFNKLTTEDFYIFEYTSLSPLQGRELTEVTNTKIFAIIEIEPGSNEYMSFAMEDFCDILVSGEFDGIKYKFAVLGKKQVEEDNESNDDEKPEDKNENETSPEPEPEEDEAIEEEEPNFITKGFATVLEALKKIVSLIKKLFSR